MNIEDLPDPAKVPEVAKLLRISAKTLYREIRSGRIGYIAVGEGGYRITRGQVSEYLARNTHSACKGLDQE
jgi:excisionase family DNA binding protein